MEQVKLVIELLRQVSTKDAVIGLLKEKKLHHSGTWDDLLEKRIIPAVKERKITIDELVALLAKAEETGRQHVFLYRANKEFVESFNKADFIDKITANNLGYLLDSPVILSRPEKTTLAAIRLDDPDVLFFAKAVSTIGRRQLVGESRDEDGYILKRYKPLESRSVSLIKINADGIVEIRVTSQDTYIRYQEEIFSLTRMLKDILPIRDILGSPISLYSAKTSIWSKREELSKLIRFSDATLKNGQGMSLRAATPTKEANLLDDKSLTDSMAHFENEDVHCDSNNIFFKMVDGQRLPTKEIHVLMSGAQNEFAVTADCKDLDYEYVLRKILEFNK